jgi:hypothetical protein
MNLIALITSCGTTSRKGGYDVERTCGRLNDISHRTQPPCPLRLLFGDGAEPRLQEPIPHNAISRWHCPPPSRCPDKVCQHLSRHPPLAAHHPAACKARRALFAEAHPTQYRAMETLTERGNAADTLRNYGWLTGDNLTPCCCWLDTVKPTAAMSR